MQQRHVRRLGAKPPIEILMDGQPVALPPQALSSLNSVRRHLELLALRQDRILAALRVDGQDLDLQHGDLDCPEFRNVHASTLTFKAICHKLVATLREQVGRLHLRVETTADQVLINDWAGATCLVRDLLLEVRYPLVLLTLLPQLDGISLDKARRNQRALTDHLARLMAIWQQVDECKMTQNTWRLADVLTQQLGSWLRQLDEYLNLLE
jgi:hypothetical protein